MKLNEKKFGKIFAEPNRNFGRFLILPLLIKSDSKVKNMRWGLIFKLENEQNHFQGELGKIFLRKKLLLLIF